MKNNFIVFESTILDDSLLIFKEFQFAKFYEL